MADLLALRLVRKGFLTDQLTLTIGYESLKDGAQQRAYKGEFHYEDLGDGVTGPFPPQNYFNFFRNLSGKAGL